MLLTKERPQAFREYRISPEEADEVGAEAVAAARTLHTSAIGCTGWAVHVSHDRLRVVTVESWRDEESYRRAGDLGHVAGRRPTHALYRHVNTDGVTPTPVGDPAAGVIVIDCFRVWRPLVRPVSAFNVRNGRAFNRSPGCVSITVLRSPAAGRIATYARWSRTEDFLAAFTATQGHLRRQHRRGQPRHRRHDPGPAPHRLPHLCAARRRRGRPIVTGAHNTTHTETEVVVSGAGPVGLTLALALARRGVRTVVLERKDRLDPHSRATLLPPRSLEVLAGVGVLPALLEHGERNPALDIRRAGDRKPVLRFDFAVDAATTAVPFALAIPQDRTERILLDAVHPSNLADVRFGRPLARFRDDGETVAVHAGDGTVITGRYLVGADGAHSRVRDQLGWPLEGTTYPTRAFLADVDIAPEADLRSGWLADPRATSFTLAIRFGDSTVDDGAVGGRWRLIESAVPDNVTDADHPTRARATTQAVFGAGSWRDTLWTAAYRKHERRARRYHLGRVILAGDAAHLNSPAGGQGLNTGLQDVHALAWRLDRLVRGDGDPERLLDSYTEERTRAFDTDVRPVTNGIERMETLPAWLRSAAFSAVGLLSRTGLPRAVTSRLSMLSPTPVSSALLDGPDPVGRRLPDVALPDGRRLHELIGPSGLLMSSHPGRPTSPLDGLALAAMPLTLPKPFAAHHELLVRPDHLVALVSDRQPLADNAVLAALGGRQKTRVR